LTVVFSNPCFKVVNNNKKLRKTQVKMQTFDQFWVCPAEKCSFISCTMIFRAIMNIRPHVCESSVELETANVWMNNKAKYKITSLYTAENIVMDVILHFC